VKPDSEGMTMKTYAIAAALAAATLLSACATTAPTESQIASCRQMESDMGVADRHGDEGTGAQPHEPLARSLPADPAAVEMIGAG
jgi:uncharacterized membrane protein